MRILFITYIVFNFCVLCNAQKTDDSCKGNRLILEKPSVFIKFDKAGERKPLYQGESNKGIWLRLVNNSCSNITVSTYGIDKQYGDYLIGYEVKKMPRWELKIKDSEVPTGYTIYNNSSAITIEPTNSLLFSVPAEHLSEGLYILVNFSYIWELGGNSGGKELDIIHKATFFSTNLPETFIKAEFK